MGAAFKRNMHVTAGFFALRFAVCIGVALAYLLVAAAIQYAFVSLLGESTFNYIVGGLLSLVLGILVCSFGGSFIFMFIRGWHVAALAYAKKIYKSGAPAISVGMTVFSKNLVSFGAVYGVRLLVKNLMSRFQDSLWDLLEDVPLLCNLQSFAESPIVEHMSRAVLDYGFDAAVYYLVRFKPESMEEIPDTIMSGLKKYLCSLPSIMATAIGTYFGFEVLPQVLKVFIILGVLFTQGVCAGILITVLLWPIFYILENAFFKPFTMMMFLTCFAAQCDKELDQESSIYKLVTSILDGEEDPENAEEDKPEPKRKKATKKEPVEEVEPEEEEAPSEPVKEPEPPPESDAVEEIDLDLDFEGEDADVPVPQESTRPAQPPDLQELLNNFAKSQEAQVAPRVRESTDAPSGKVRDLSAMVKGIDISALNQGFGFDEINEEGE